jgi:hypothetical protein
MSQGWSDAAFPLQGAVMSLPQLGIDIAKLKFNVCLLPANGKLKHKVFSNNQAGFTQLRA